MFTNDSRRGPKRYEEGGRWVGKIGNKIREYIWARNKISGLNENPHAARKY